MRLSLGAQVVHDKGVQFRVWAPLRKQVEVVSGSSSWQLTSAGDGYYAGIVPQLNEGSRYRFRLDGGDSFPDPTSRFQPDGPHGESQVVDPSKYRWSDGQWQGLSLENQIVYEMHIGTFTEAGTFQAAIKQLPELAAFGATVLEVMPLADFTGSFGWGYDGVNWFAPSRLYGTPDDFRAFVDKAHSLQMAVILDVVYNHFGADGNYLGQFSSDYLSRDHVTDWGEAINFDGPNSKPVRDYVVSNASYWVEEYHLDGLRLDATQDIHDSSPVHILAEITEAVRKAGAGRKTIVLAENEPQTPDYVRPRENGGFGMDGLWNDDFHHSAMVAATGHKEAYYSDYLGKPQEFISALKYGYLYQGQLYKWQKQRRGRPSFGVPASAFITFIQNHDQIANSARGQRIHELTSPGLCRALSALVLLGPGTPMLFQGQEFASSSPFLYFADVPENLRPVVCDGRKEFLAQFRSLRMPEMVKEFENPCDRKTFERCKLDLSEREKHDCSYTLHKDLIRVRRSDATLRKPQRFDGAVLSEHAFCFRTFNEDTGDRLLVVNLGIDLHLNPAPEPLLAPPEEQQWEIAISTEDARYGGSGTAPLETEDNWTIPGYCAVLLQPAPRQPLPRGEAK